MELITSSMVLTMSFRELAIVLTMSLRELTIVLTTSFRELTMVLTMSLRDLTILLTTSFGCSLRGSQANLNIHPVKLYSSSSSGVPKLI